MKVVLSRKGFDSSFGGCASPIFDDNTLISLPIPHWFQAPPRDNHQRAFNDLAHERPIAELVEDLTRNRARPVTRDERVHLDPDLRFGDAPRLPGWRPLFGQSDQAQRHLENHRVGRGDLFLFFGWFRRVCRVHGRYHFEPGAPDLHVLFGWLRIGEVWRVGRDVIPDWAQNHPHAFADFGPSNTIYVAAPKGAGYDAGTFRAAVDELVLTSPDSALRSCWQLPRWFHPDGRGCCLSYHKKLKRWRRDNRHAFLSTVGRGQEFVLDADHYPEAVAWSNRLIDRNALQHPVRPAGQSSSPVARSAPAGQSRRSTDITLQRQCSGEP